MKKDQNIRGEKALKASKEAFRFLIILLIKLLQKPKKSSLEVSSKNNSQNVISLLKLVYKTLKGNMQQKVIEVKELKSNKHRAKRTFKTRARIKQDFKEWYNSIIEEYEKKNQPLLDEKMDKSNQ
jgi:hypothetical protein